MNKCDLSGAGVMFTIWIFAFLIEGAFEKELGGAGGFLLLTLGIVGVWFGIAVRKQCKSRASDPQAN